MREHAPQTIIDLLQQAPLFKGLDSAALSDLAESSSVSSLDEGEVLFGEGEMATELTFVLSGSIRLTCGSPEGVEIVVGYVQSGDILGEMAVVDPAPRSATARAAEASQVLHLGADAFADFIDRGHPVAKVMLLAIRQMMTHRIRVLNERIGALFLLDAEQEDGAEPPSMVVRLRDIWSTMRSGG